MTQASLIVVALVTLWAISVNSPKHRHRPSKALCMSSYYKIRAAAAETKDSQPLKGVKKLQGDQQKKKRKKDVFSKNFTGLSADVCWISQGTEGEEFSMQGHCCGAALLTTTTSHMDHLRPETGHRCVEVPHYAGN